MKTDHLAKFARVPEHSPELMGCLSGGKPLVIDSWLFFAGGDWLSAIAYPLMGKYDGKSFEAALERAIRRTGARSCFAIGPELPAKLQGHIVDRDRYYVLGTDAKIPSRLVNPVKKARQRLAVSENTQFTSQHRQLWAEFMRRSASGGSSPMHARVRELYTATPKAMSAGNANLRLLDARDENGKLVASLLLDYAPRLFTSYILGAHSRKNYVPHAHDLLFAEMISRSKDAGKHFIHLGLGVNEGILRFKLKWGARAYFPYLMAQWTEQASADAPETHGEDSENVGQTLALALMRFQGNISARQALGDTPGTKPFAMLWQVEKQGKISWLGGTAHFFCHGFEPSFRSLFKDVDNVIFEGPLDAAFMAKVDEAGRTLPQGMPPLANFLEEEDIIRLERVVWGPQGKLAKALGMAWKNKKDVRWLLNHARPWHAFFSLWTAFLERNGWNSSVDMEAWRIAGEMGKNIIAMESMEEQLDSLGSLPVERVINFFRSCDQWKTRSRRNMHAYLAGDLEKMMGSSAEFPTRTEYVIGRRDQRFRERMRPYLEQGRCAVFVGSAHLVNLRRMLVEDGFSVRQQPFGILPRLRLGLRRILGKEDVQW